MPITKHQRKQRLTHIGSSDSPRILGLSRFGNASDVFFEKVPDFAGTVAEVPEKTNPAIEAGNVLENAILQHASENLGVGITRNQFRVSKERPLFSASFDAIIPDRPREAIEAKATAVVFPASREMREQWGDENTDDVPNEYLIQCQHQCFVGGLDRVWLFALIGGRGFVRYNIERNDELIGEIVEHGLDFWKCVEKRTPPDPNALPPMEMLKAIERRDGEPVELCDRGGLFLGAYLEFLDQEKLYKRQKEKALQNLLTLMGDAESGLASDGDLFTYKEQTRKTIDTKRLALERPEIFAEYLRESIFRVPRIKKAKSNSTIKEKVA